MLGRPLELQSESPPAGDALEPNSQDDIERQLGPERHALRHSPNLNATVPNDPPLLLTWSTIIPELSLEFYVDTTHVHYSLYHEARIALREKFPPSAVTCASISEHKPLSRYPPSVGKLINLLADQYCIQNSPEEILDYMPAATSVLDFILYGMLVVVSRRHKLNSTVTTSDHTHVECHTLCTLRHRQPSTLDDQVGHMAVFLDIFSTLWVEECSMRRRAKWSPMPWSEVSRERQVATAPYPNADEIVSLSSPPQLKALDIDHRIFRQRRAAFGLPINIPWLGPRHDGYPFSPTLTDYVQLRRINKPCTPHDDLALWINAMTIGLLEGVFGTKVAEAELLSIDESTGESVLSGSLILRQIFKGEQYWLQRRDLPTFLERGHSAASLLKHALMAIGEECQHGLSMGERAGLQDEQIQEALCGVTLSTTALCRCAASLWGAVIPQIEPLLCHTEASHSSTYLIASVVCKRKLTAAGWCPNTISLPFVTFLSRPMLSHMLHLDPFIPGSSNGHRNCTDEACVFYTFANGVDPPTLHATSFCSCEPIRPPNGEVERLLSDEAIPVLTYDNGQLRVCRADSTAYIAISHVWAEGMGSTTEVGLPTCQVARLAFLARTLLPDSGGAFWMDSLCVPAVRHLRKRAIKLMAETYAGAAGVLVIDASIRKLCSRAEPWEANILRIATSAWVRRVWTLQEGLLARRLFFEFADGLVDGAELETQGSFSSEFYEPFLPLLAMRHQHGRAAPARRRSGSPVGSARQTDSPASGHQYTLDEVIGLLRLRTTSHPEDEPVAIAGLLPSIEVDTLFDIRSPAQRLATFYRQIGRLPRRFPMLPVPKLDLPRYRWAPRGIGLAMENSMGHFDYATCDEDGLHGVYAVARLQEPLAIPLEYRSEGQKAPPVFIRTMVHEPSVSAHQAAFIMACVPVPFAHQLTTIDALLFYEDKRFSGDQGWTAFAAVHTHSTGEAEEGQSDAKPLLCEFVAPGNIHQLVECNKDGALSLLRLEMKHVLLK